MVAGAPLLPAHDAPLNATEPSGEWLSEKHGTKKRRAGRELYLGVDAATGPIVAAEVTANAGDDGAQVGPLLDQVAGPVASFTGAGADDRGDVDDAGAERPPDAAVVVPPRSNAVPSEVAGTTATRRDRHLQLSAERGRLGWPKAAGYDRRALAEAAVLDPSG